MQSFAQHRYLQPLTIQIGQFLCEPVVTIQPFEDHPFPQQCCMVTFTSLKHHLLVNGAASAGTPEGPTMQLEEGGIREPSNNSVVT